MIAPAKSWGRMSLRRRLCKMRRGPTLAGSGSSARSCPRLASTPKAAATAAIARPSVRRWIIKCRARGVLLAFWWTSIWRLRAGVASAVATTFSSAPDGQRPLQRHPVLEPEAMRPTHPGAKEGGRRGHMHAALEPVRDVPAAAGLAPVGVAPLVVGNGGDDAGRPSRATDGAIGDVGREADLVEARHVRGRVGHAGSRAPPRPRSGPGCGGSRPRPGW